MAAASAPAPPASSSGGKGLTRKVGPLPVWGWAALGFGFYYWWTHYGPGAATSTSGTGTASGQPLTIGNITITNTGGRGRAGTPGSSTGGSTSGGGTPAPPHKCPKGYFWDPDDLGGKGRCVKIKGHKGPDQPGSDTATAAPASSSSVKTGKHRPRPPVKAGGTTSPAGATSGSPGGAASTDLTINAGGQPQTAPTGGPVNADTGQPVFYEWEHRHRGPEIAEPVQAYAPMTNGATYGPAAVDIAAAAAGS